MFRYEDNEPETPWGQSVGTERTINVHFVRLPFIFEEDENHTKQQLSSAILNLFNV